MIKVKGKEVRCKRCRALLCRIYAEKTILMQYSKIELEDEKVWDMNNNEVACGNMIKCRFCTQRNELEFEIKNPCPTSSEELDKRQSPELARWLNKQLVSNRREPKFPLQLVDLGTEIFPYSSPQIRKIRVVDEGMTKKGRRITEYEFETKDYVIRPLIIEEPEVVMAQGKYSWPLAMLLSWLTLEHRTTKITAMLPELVKLLSYPKEKRGSWKSKVIEGLLASFHQSSYKMISKKTGKTQIWGQMINRLKIEDKRIEIDINEDWVKDCLKLINDGRGEYLSFPNRAILGGVSLMQRNFAISLAKQKGKSQANFKVKTLLEMGYKNETIKRMTIDEKIKAVREVLDWAASNGLLRGKIIKDEKVWWRSITKDNGKERKVNDWVVICYPRGRGERREGKLLTEPG